MRNPVTIAKRIHLYPSRTQKLSSLALKILGGQPPGKIGRRRFFRIRPHGQEVKTSPFHGGNPGSIPGGVTIYLSETGGTGRRTRFRFWRETVGVRVPCLAPQDSVLTEFFYCSFILYFNSIFIIQF